jgi:hypothetical protein
MDESMRARGLILVACLAAALGVGIGGCSGPGTPTVPTPTPTPTPPATPTPTPPPAPPTIASMSVSSPRVEADGQLQVTAVVGNGDIPPADFTWAWSARPVNGVFTGTGAQVNWQAPRLQQTPDTYALTLGIKAPYKDDGTPKEYEVSSSVQVHYNDSTREVSGITTQFLRDFTTFSVSPDQCVRNFSDSCPGRADELYDIQQNRALFHINGGTFSVSSVTLNSDRTRANVVAPCTFYNLNATGGSDTVVGTCLLTSTYEKWAWWLCESHFQGASVTMSSNRYMYMHP